MRPDVEAIKNFPSVPFVDDGITGDALWVDKRKFDALIAWIEELEADTKQLCAAIDQLAAMVGLGRDE